MPGSYLKGLKEYLETAYAGSIFDDALASGETFTWHLHGQRVLNARVIKNLVYDVDAESGGGNVERIAKVQVKCLFPQAVSDRVQAQVKVDPKVRALGLEPILAPSERFHIKNKTLFPLMQTREVLFFTLLEGEVLRGIVAGFSRYEITVHLKGGLPVTVLRHAVYDLRNKRGRCFLKSVQETLRDWEKSPLFVPVVP